MKKILVIGSTNADLTIHTNRMPSLGETVEGFDFSINAGGKGANQAVAVAKLGGYVRFLGAVGNDSNGKMLLDNLEKSGVKFSGFITEESSTGTASITVVNGDNFIILNAGANNCITPAVVDKYSNLIENSDILVMQLEIPLESVIRAAEIAKQSKTLVVLNPAPCKELPDDFLENIDIIVPNEHEASLLTGINIDTEDSCKRAIEILKDKDIGTVIITLGGKGCVYNHGDIIRFRSAEKTTVVDTTSAGDTFIGAVCCGLAEGMDLELCIDLATKASAITVSRKGASCSIPTRDEIK
ncbi:MAG: ribokinase [Acutalibacteraceae bacterium]|nr:ribokinase [Acutalibacteraceae bacterium]